MSHSVLINAHDAGTFSAYVAVSPKGVGPGLVLLQYIFGVNKVMRDLADHYASFGYFVVVPDLFWRQEADVRLADDPATATPEEVSKAMALNDAFNDDKALSDLSATYDFVKSHPGCNGKVGVLGFCLGGRLSYRMAAHVPVDCAVAYYGVHLERHLDEAARIATPILMHMAGSDFLVPEPLRQQIVQALSPNPNVRIETYEGVNHAFALKGGANYNAAAADLANARSEQFLRQHLMGDRADV